MTEQKSMNETEKCDWKVKYRANIARTRTKYVTVAITISNLIQKNVNCIQRQRLNLFHYKIRLQLLRGYHKWYIEP